MVRARDLRVLLRATIGLKNELPKWSQNAVSADHIINLSWGRGRRCGPLRQV